MTDATLKGALVAARKAAQGAKSESFSIPGFGGKLWGTFRGLDDYGEVREIVKASRTEPDEATRELYNAADTLLAASVDTYALLEGGAKESLGLKLGLPLAQYLADEEQNNFADAETDRQAVFLLFPNTMSIMALFTQYDVWNTNEARGTEQVLEGKSGAPS